MALLDADDTWMPDKLERQLEILEVAGSHTKAGSTRFQS